MNFYCVITETRQEGQNIKGAGTLILQEKNGERGGRLTRHRSRFWGFAEAGLALSHCVHVFI